MTKRLRFCHVLLALPLIFSGQAIAEDAVAQETAKPGPLRIVTYGTSLTARGGWQEPLAARLRTCLSRPVEIPIVAKSGATSDWAVSIVDDVVAAAPDIVLVELYANDGALNRLVTVAHSRDNLRHIFARLRRDLPAARVVAMGMNPFSGLRGMMRPFVDSYIDAHRALAQEFGFDFVDHRPAWLSRSQAWRSAAIPDGVHPRPAAAAEIMVPALARLIGGAACAGG